MSPFVRVEHHGQVPWSDMSALHVLLAVSHVLGVVPAKKRPQNERIDGGLTRERGVINAGHSSRLLERTNWLGAVFLLKFFFFLESRFAVMADHFFFFDPFSETYGVAPLFSRKNANLL